MIRSITIDDKEYGLKRLERKVQRLKKRLALYDRLLDFARK